MKKFFIIIIIITLLISLDIWINRKELFNIVTVDDISNDLYEFSEKYQGVKQGNDVGNMLLRLWARTQEIIRRPKLAKKIDTLPTVFLYQEDINREVKYQKEDIKLYAKNLDDIVSLIDVESYFNVNISCNSEGIPTKIIIEKYKNYTETPPKAKQYMMYLNLQNYLKKLSSYFV